MVALVLLAVGLSQVRQSKQNDTGIIIGSSKAAANGVPVLTVMPDAWAINSQPVQDGDLLFRLSALSATSPAVIIEHGSSVTATRLTQALETVNRAGFSQAGVRPEK